MFRLIGIVFPLCVLGLFLRFQYRALQDLGGDELYQLRVLDRPFGEFVRKLPELDFCSYLNGDYFLMYPFLKWFGFNKYMLAIPHLVLTMLGFYFLFLICRKYFKTTGAYVITFGIVCWNTTLIAHALEIRPYAVLPTLALAVFLLLDEIFSRYNDIRPLKRALIGIFFALAVLFHPYGILMIFVAAVYLSLAIHKDLLKRNGGRVVRFCGAALLAALPLWCLSIWGEHRPYDWQGIQDVFQFIPHPFVDAIGFLKGIFCNLIGRKALYFFMIALIFPVLLPYPERYHQMGFFLIMIVFPIVMILLMDLKSGYWFVQRQFIWIMPFFAFFLGWCWDSGANYFLSRTRRNRMLRGGCLK